MGLLARFFEGGLSIPEMKNMTWDEIEKWHDIFVLQKTEEEVIQELSFDSKGNKQKLPNNNKIREIVLQRIEDMKNKNEV